LSAWRHSRFTIPMAWWLTQSTGTAALPARLTRARQHCRRVLDAAVVIEEHAAGAFHHRLELRHLVRPAAHVKHERPAELGHCRRCFGFCAFGPDLSGIAIACISRQPVSELRLDERKLLMQSLDVAFGGVAPALGLSQCHRHALDARLEPLALGDLPIEAAADIG
jgi:hypothetical protein